MDRRAGERSDVTAEDEDQTSVEDSVAVALKATVCRCGAAKQVGHPFCMWNCYQRLSAAMRRLIFTQPGYEQAAARLDGRIPRAQKWKTVSIMQPWASALVRGLRNYETRTDTTDYRGKIAICSMRQAANHLLFPDWFQRRLADDGLLVLKTDLVDYWAYTSEVKLGRVLAVARLVDVVPAESVPEPEHDDYGRYEAGRWAWKFADIRPVDGDVETPPYRQEWVRLLDKKV